jgi:drug/metabolite transporter (DMT)-like permease
MVWGLTPALARMASGIGSNPVGLAVWVNGIAAVCCLSVSAFRGTLPKLTRQEFLFFLQWAIVAGVLLRLLIFWVTGHVEATMLSLIVTLEGLMVFALAAVMRLERASPRRLLGMLVSIAGVCGAVLARAEFSTSTSIGWILVSLLVPLLFGVQGLLIASRRPERIDIFAAGGIMMLISASLLFPIAFLSGQLLPLGPAIGRLEIVVALMGIGAAASLLLIFHLTATTGAVFASLNSYSCSLAGIFWGVLLLGEQMSAAAWLATCGVFIGLYLVGPKLSDDELVLDRSFSSRVPSEST